MALTKGKRAREVRLSFLRPCSQQQDLYFLTVFMYGAAVVCGRSIALPSTLTTNEVLVFFPKCTFMPSTIKSKDFWHGFLMSQFGSPLRTTLNSSGFSLSKTSIDEQGPANLYPVLSKVLKCSLPLTKQLPGATTVEEKEN